MKKILLLTIVLLVVCGVANAHSGKTDSSGGHYNRSTGEYHYHHGYSAHQHVDGECPYDYDDKTGTKSGSTGSGYTSYSNTSYTNSSYDWYDEYSDAQAARRAAEKELKEMKSLQLRNLALSCAVGLAGGLSLLIVQVQRSNKRLEEREKWLLERAKEAVEKAKREAEDEWFSRLKDAKAERDDAELKLIDERSAMQIELAKYEENRRQASAMFLEMAKNAPDVEQKNVYLSRVVMNALPPTPNDGLVYVPMDLNTKVYHREYYPCGIEKMVLASKKNVSALGLIQCPVCSQAAQPTGDMIVFASPTKTNVYHVKDSYCAGYTAHEIRLSEAIKRGLRPCSKCNPPHENPKVWF